MAVALSWLVHSIADFLCPPTKRPAYQTAEECFTAEELAAIRKEHCCHVLSKYTSTVDDAHFLEWAGLQSAPEVLKQGLCNAVRRHNADHSSLQITLEAVVIAKSLSEKMDRQSAEDFAFDVVDLQHTGQIGREHLQEIIDGCMQMAMGGASCPDEAAALAAGVCGLEGPECCEITRESFSKLCKASPALLAALTSLLTNIGASAGASGPSTSNPAGAAAAAEDSQHGSSQQLLDHMGASAAIDSPSVSAPESSSRGKQSRSGRAAALAEAAGPGPGSAAIAAASAAARGPGRMLLPQLSWGNVSPREGLLQPGWVWLLAAGLAPAQRIEWRLLYNSQKHGISFSTFLGRLGDASPTLLLIRDKGKALFGGIAHSPWKKAGSFYGDHASLIFSLLPVTRIYAATGINANLQWCGIGFSQLPNGVGFGGQVGHFGLWLDATMDHGMSRPSATFASACLASTEVFQVDVVEVWQLMPPQEEEANAAAGSKANNTKPGSALDKAKEDQQILEWAGVGKNYRANIDNEPIED